MTKQTYFPKGKGPTSAEVDRVEKAFLEIVQRQDGTLIRHSEIAEAAGLEYGTEQYYRVVQRWRKRMRREYGLVITTKTSAGYCAVPDEGKTDVVVNKHRAAARRIREGGEIVKATNRGNLTETGQKTYDMVAVQTADLLRRSRMLTRTAAVELHGTPQLPASEKSNSPVAAGESRKGDPR